MNVCKAELGKENDALKTRFFHFGSDADEHVINEATEHLRERCDELEKARKAEFDDATRARAGRADADARAERARTAAEKAVAVAHAEAAKAGALAEEAASRCVQLGTELAKERERCDALHRALDERDAFHSKDLDVLRREMELAIEATERATVLDGRNPGFHHNLAQFHGAMFKQRPLSHWKSFFAARKHQSLAKRLTRDVRNAR